MRIKGLEHWATIKVLAEEVARIADTAIHDAGEGITDDDYRTSVIRQLTNKIRNMLNWPK